MATKKQLVKQASKAIDSQKLNAVLAANLEKTMASVTEEVKTPKASKKKETQVVEKQPKKITLKKKVSQVEKEVDDINKTTLVEQVVSNREVKYIYPADVNDTLSRKSWRQKVRNKLHKLEMAMYRIKDQNSKEFAKARKEYEDFYSTVCKPNVAV